MKTLVLIAILVLAGPASADTLYTYTGPNFSMVTGDYAPTDHVSGWFVLDANFVPVGGWTNPNSVITPGVLDYRFTDGHQTLTPSIVTSARFLLAPPDRAPIPGVSRQANYFIELFGANGGYLVTRLDYSGENIDRGASASGSGTCWPVQGAYGCSDHIGGTQLLGTWTVETVSVPERAILPRLPRLLKFGLGLGLEAKITTVLQRATAWLAAAILRAPRDGVTILMPRVSVEVAEACSGLQTLLLMLGAAALLALTARHGHAGKLIDTAYALKLFVLFGAATLLALEANALRVAGIAMGLEYVGAMTRGAKDWIQVGTTGIALAQLVGVGRLVARGRAVPQPVTV